MTAHFAQRSSAVEGFSLGFGVGCIFPFRIGIKEGTEMFGGSGGPDSCIVDIFRLGVGFVVWVWEFELADNIFASGICHGDVVIVVGGAV